MRKISLLLLMVFGSLFAYAQDEDTQDQEEKMGDIHVSNYRDWSIGLQFGQFMTFGDLSTFNTKEEDVFAQFDYGIGLHVTKYLSSVWGIKGQATYGRLGGSNGAVEPNTVVTFENSPYFDYNLNAVLNLSALSLTGVQKDRNFSLLVSAGLGMSQSKQTRFVDGNEVAVYAQGQGGGPDNEWTNEVFLPADVTAKWQLGNAWDLDAGVQVKYFFSDIIDALPAGSSNDVVVYPNIGVSYNFGHDEAQSVVYTNPLDDIYFDLEEVKDNFGQLTSDDDEDGVSNYFDEDDSTPEGVAVTGAGVPMDVDNDGIPDYMDEDLFTGKGAQVDAQGRAIDSDNDGVADYRDTEPNTPEGALVNFQGKEISGSMGGAAYMPSVYFPFNSAVVTTANEERLATIALALKNNSDISIKLVGNADVRGPEQYNMELARRRAESVKEKLVQIFNIDGARISIESQGEATPLAEPRENYSLNRRVDVYVNE